MTVTVDRTVEEFTAAPRKLFINGQWPDAASGKTIETPKHSTGETLATSANSDSGEIEPAVLAAGAAIDEGRWRNVAPSDRGRIIWRIGSLFLEHAEELTQL